MPAPMGHPPYNTKGEGGRPKIYTEEYLNNEADALIEWLKDEDNIFIEDFCLKRDHHESRIDEFVDDNERFAVAYNKLKMKQRTALFKGSLTRQFAHPMCALILSHGHKIYQRTDQKVESKNTNVNHNWVTEVSGTTTDLVNGSTND